MARSSPPGTRTPRSPRGGAWTPRRGRRRIRRPCSTAVRCAPFGGHKGSGISVLLEGLATVLTSASLAARTVDIWEDRSSRMNTGHLLIALDLAAFGDPAQIRDRVAELQAEVRSSHPGGTVVAPGDLEHDRAAADDGVELAASTAERLRALARAHDLPFPDPRPDGISR
ncbi:Ldh family oxidoreductase [Brachybacterium sp. GPGPB12]|uniref:Ldh family oxidoreductase n=1 Tax=Brachybacterium sp. GPGPB12 TaxID=3023517 RepID=UPI0031344B0B